MKELVASLTPLPTRPPSSIIQIAKASGVTYDSILAGTRFTPLTYQSLWISLKLVYVKVLNRRMYRNLPFSAKRVLILGMVGVQ